MKLWFLIVAAVFTMNFDFGHAAELEGRIHSANGESELCLDAKDYGAHKKGGELQLWPCNDSIHQNWRLKSSGEIVSDGGRGLCLDAADYGARNKGNRLQLWPCNGDISQKWLLTHADEIVSAGGDDGLCLDAKDYGAYNEGNELQLWPCNGDIHQKWRFK